MGLVAENAVTHIIVVGSLYVVKEYYVLQFNGVAHNTVLADESAPSYESTVAHLCTCSDNAGSPQISCGENLCGLMYPYVLGGIIILIGTESLSQLDYKAADALESFPRICEPAEIILCSCMREIVKI